MLWSVLSRFVCGGGLAFNNNNKDINMCGLFGAVGVGINGDVVRMLAILNESRGRDSLGFFDSTGQRLKLACRPSVCLQQPKFSDLLRKTDSLWFVAGHTRQATQGKVSNSNAHPFRYGDYIGSHNGIVYSPAEYTVDSEYLIDLLNQHKGDYQKAFADVSGYWALSVFDGNHLWFHTWDNSLFMAEVKGATYYSSSKQDLLTAIGSGHEVREVGDGDTLRFDPSGVCEKMPRFHSDHSWVYSKASTSGYGGYSCDTTTSSKSGSIWIDDTPTPTKPQGKKGKKKAKQQLTDLLTESPTLADRMAYRLGYGDFRTYRETLKTGTPLAEAHKRMCEDLVEVKALGETLARQLFSCGLDAYMAHAGYDAEWAAIAELEDTQHGMRLEDDDKFGPWADNDDTTKGDYFDEFNTI